MKKKTKDYLKYKVATNTESTFHSICTRYIPNAISEVVELAPKLKGKTDLETCKKIDRFIRDNVTYKNDEPGYEEIRFPNRLLADKVGDCEDFTILGSAVLQNLGVAHTIRMADYGKGWQHIYIKVGNVTLDPVQKGFNQEDKGKYLDFHIDPKGHGLGIIEKEYHTEREQFILALWTEFIKDGVSFEKFNNVYENKLPVKNISLLIPYIHDRLGYNCLLKEDSLRKGEYVSIEVILFDKSKKLTINPHTLAQIVFDIEGKKALDKAMVSVKKSKELSPLNNYLMNYLKPFCAKNGGNKLLEGVCFNEDEIAVTDGNKLVMIKGKSNFNATYDLDGKKIYGNYIEYQNYIPAYKDLKSIVVNVSNLLQLLKKALKYADKEEHIISLFPTRKRLFVRAEDTFAGIVNVSNTNCKYTGEESMITINAKFLIELLSLCSKDKVKDISIQFSDNESTILIEFDGYFGVTKLVLRKLINCIIMYETDSKGSIVRRFKKYVNYSEVFPEYIDRFNSDLPYKSENGISPYNRDLMSLLSAFTYKHELSKGAILFKYDGVVTADLHKAIFIEGRPSLVGTFNPEGMGVKGEYINDINTDFDGRIDFQIKTTFSSFKKGLRKLAQDHEGEYITLLPMITKLLATTKPYDKGEILKTTDFQEIPLENYRYSGSFFPMRYRFDHLIELIEVMKSRYSGFDMLENIEISFVQMGLDSPYSVRGLLVRFPSKLGMINILLRPKELMLRESNIFNKTYINIYESLFYEEVENALLSFKSRLNSL